jgi:hypothetical protein
MAVIPASFSFSHEREKPSHLVSAAQRGGDGRLFCA